MTISANTDFEDFSASFDRAWNDFHSFVKPLSDRFSFKSFKHFKSMSEETMCFEAALFFDGKKVGYARNNGHGGCTDVYIEKQDVRELVDAEMKRLWSSGHPDSTFHLETLISSLASDYSENKDWEAYAKRAMKRGGTAFRCARAETPTRTDQFAMLNSRNPASVKKAKDDLVSQGFVVIAEA
jgi:hypothetical protein